MIRQFISDKVILCNAGALTISFTQVENTLKIILLLASIVYTLTRIYKEYDTTGEKK